MSHDELLSWLEALRLPELVSRTRLRLHSLLFWTEVLESPDPGLAPKIADSGQQPRSQAPCTVRMATASALTLRPREERDGADGSARRTLLEEQFAGTGLRLLASKKHGRRNPRSGGAAGSS